MMQNNRFSEIGAALFGANRILLFTHVNMDGDTLGSAAALCHGLRQAGKEAWVLIGETIPEDLAFLDQNLCIRNVEASFQPDVCVSVDCSDLGRLGDRGNLFMQAPVRICIDHHATNDVGFAQLNCIHKEAAATGELIYEILTEMSQTLDQDLISVACAEAMYAAIVTDTGNFQYSNTTKRTHEITAALFDKGIDHTRISIELYQNMRAEKLKVQARILDNMQMLCHGKANLAWVDQTMIQETGAAMDETEGTVEQMRNIRGVEISAFLKEMGQDEIKVSLRAKSWGNVAEIASQFGGGGHTKAAGCTIHGSLAYVSELIRQEICAQIQSADK